MENQTMTLAEKALLMHEKWNGKLETIAKSKVNSREDLAIAYTPGVAEPCKMIAKDPEAAYKYTMKANTVAVIAEGTESGGHVGEMTTMALVPQVVDAVSVPVIAAGGIADGRQLAAALALGACGVQVGTCLLASEECPIHPNYKAALLKAGDSDTIVTGRTVGAPVRVLKNRMSREYVRQEKAGADKMELEKYTLGSLRRAVFEGDTVSGSLMAGQVAGMLHEVRPVADILADLWQGGRQRIAALNTEC